MLYSKKGQAWVMDFIIGFMLFSAAAILASRLIINASGGDEFSEVRSGAETMSEYLLSEGVPHNWTNDSVVRIGLTTSNRLNTTKLANLYSMSYEDTRFYLTTNYHYLIFFKQDNSILNITGCGYGAISFVNCSVNLSIIDYENLVVTNRFVTYNKSIIEMVLYVWK